MSKKSSSKTAQKKALDGKLGAHSVGDSVVIRAIPYHYIGKISSLGAHGVTLAAGAVWLADSARWASDFLRDGKVNESEPYPDGVFIGYGVIADVTRWNHDIPGQK